MFLTECSLLPQNFGLRIPTAGHHFSPRISVRSFLLVTYLTDYNILVSLWRCGGVVTKLRKHRWWLAPMAAVQRRMQIVMAAVQQGVRVACLLDMSTLLQTMVRTQMRHTGYVWDPGWSAGQPVVAPRILFSSWLITVISVCDVPGTNFGSTGKSWLCCDKIDMINLFLINT